MSNYRPEGALLVGGVNLPTAEDVFDVASATIGDRLSTLPDGETGPRVQWIIWQFEVLARARGLNRIPKPEQMYGPWDRFVATGGEPIEIPEMGYAAAATASYRAFDTLKADGVIPAHVRFQVSLPMALDITTVFVPPADVLAVEAAYEQAIQREVQTLVSTIPHDQLAIQWDVCWEIAYLEGLLPAPWGEDVLGGVTERLVRHLGMVPAGVETGVHLCYGSYQNEHFLEPRDMSVMVSYANATADAARRPLNWMHFPVPRDRSDAAYFGSLGDLALSDQTRLYLGLVHLADGAAGTNARIAAAADAAGGRPFGVACECGMARVPSTAIRDWLELHAEVSNPIADPRPRPRADVASPDAKPRGVHLVGTVPLAGPEEVFRALANVLPGHLRRMTDGETGARLNWVGGQFPILMGLSELEQTDPPAEHYGPPIAFAVRPGIRHIDLPRLGYADSALASFEEFSALKRSGIVPPHMRFQVSLPTPLALTLIALVPESREVFEAAYTTKLLGELDEILGAIPHDELSIQWDVCQEVGLWEGFYPPHGEDDGRRQARRELHDLTAAVPDDVDLGFHLCYGDYEHRHFTEPRDLGTLVEMAQALIADATRSITYIHMPVPIGRDDDAYFTPLQALALPPDTELFLGVLHHEDGAQGAAARIRAAHTARADFGVATECGFGRRSPMQVGELLRLHRHVAEPTVPEADPMLVGR